MFCCLLHLSCISDRERVFLVPVGHCQLEPYSFRCLRDCGSFCWFVCFVAFPLWAPSFSIVLPSCLLLILSRFLWNPALVPLSLFHLSVTQFPDPLDDSQDMFKPLQLTILSQFSWNPSPWLITKMCLKKKNQHYPNHTDFLRVNRHSFQCKYLCL